MVISKALVKGVLNRDLGWIPNLGQKLHIVDASYKTISKTFVLNQIRHDEWLQPKLAYKPEVFDCDDFAIHLKTKLAKLFYHRGEPLPAALGFIVTARHAFNFSIDKASDHYRLVLYDTVHTTLEERPQAFAQFLDFRPGNTIKLLYI